MWYHAITEANRKRYWWNRNKEDLINDILVPFVTKQVQIVNRNNRKILYNFGTVTYITIVKTERKLSRPKPGAIPLELQDKNFIDLHNVTEEFVNDLRLLSVAFPSKSLIQYALATPIKQVFVIMKFGDKEMDSAYKGVIKPVGEEFGFKVIRVDEIQDSGNINEQVLENITKSQIILADFSGERPNCYYEAGFAHALGKKMIFCIKEGEKIHFDLASHRFILWGTEMELREKLRDRFYSIVSQEEQ